MITNLNLLRNHGRRLWAFRMERRGFNFFQQQRLHHPVSTPAPTPTVERRKNDPKCRFMQYRRSNETFKRLAMVSDDGSKMVELSSLTCASPNMQDFIQQRYAMDNLLDSVQYMKVEDVEAVDFQLLPPIECPSKIIAVDCNYVDNCDEQHISIPREPTFHVKFSNAITGALDAIKAPSSMKRIDYGCHLAVIMGKKCREVTPKEALNHVFGFMVAQDIVAKERNVVLGGHSMDTFFPVGPIILHRCHMPDVNNLWIRTLVNGDIRQSGNTRDMIFKVDFLIHRLSHYLTLYPGDVILTGTPAGAGAYQRPTRFLKPGDLIESEIQNLGKMCNKVINPYA
ncbi:uncharacterized protein Dana_GF10417 [Drosophila ananassae]|uniref:Fumarylacetoacetase-like C-terminal domain-containing protein n=1 Tax=Drosophila ananassae TaxID=7217 RepID=B3MAY8_DROAN|nr:fumarylacetoacetate hydrolase domain-containing protein 2 [Drosophila ananassae]EDV40254.2 uncharacterized protein Dana_GF10417 [Drosophila ananassae]